MHHVEKMYKGIVVAVMLLSGFSLNAMEHQKPNLIFERLKILDKRMKVITSGGGGNVEYVIKGVECYWDEVLLPMANDLIELERSKIEMLLKNNPTLLESTDKNGKTPLIVAAQIPATVLVKLFVKNGANIKQADDSGHTALDYSTVQKSIIPQLIFDSFYYRENSYYRELKFEKPNMNASYALLQKALDRKSKEKHE